MTYLLSLNSYLVTKAMTALPNNSLVMRQAELTYEQSTRDTSGWCEIAHQANVITNLEA